MTFAAGASLALNTPAAAATILTGAGCSLAQAITSANTDTVNGTCSAGSGPDTIVITADETLTAALPMVTSQLTLRAGPHRIWRDPSGVRFRILRVSAPGKLSIYGGDLAHGFANLGGGVRVDAGGELTLHGTWIHDCLASQHGGGIYSDAARVEVEDAKLTSNWAGWSGGGIWNEGGQLTVRSSRVEENIVDEGGGAGIGSEDHTALLIEDTYFLDNVGGDTTPFGPGDPAVPPFAGAGGGLYLERGFGASVSRCQFENNVTDRGGGLYLRNAPGVAVVDSGFYRNAGRLAGGAMVVESSEVTVLRGVWASNAGAGEESATGPGYFGFGGGAYVFGTSHVSIDGAVITGNHTRFGGGLSLDGAGVRLDVRNTTIVRNLGTNGGGIFANQAQVQLDWSTVIGHTLAGHDCHGTFIVVSAQGSFDSDGTCPF